MTPEAGELFSFEALQGRTVSARLLLPPAASALYVLAHGAGAGMDHPSLSVIARGFFDLGIATLRYQFPYMQQQLRRTDAPAVCHATVRAAVAQAARRAPHLPLFAGGRSFGGRMTSQAQALAPLAEVRGLVFLAFPLHPAGKPAVDRAAHLSEVGIPMLFIQGTRDALAERGRLENMVGDLGALATLSLIDDADHSFHVPARSGRTDANVRVQWLAQAARWMEQLS